MRITKIMCLIAGTVVALSLSACSGTSAPAETAAAAPTKSSAPVQGSSEQTVQDACMAMAGPIAEASTAISEAAQASAADPQTAVDAWTGLANGFETIVNNAQNADVKVAATAAHTDIAAVRDAIQKVFVGKDMGAMSEFTAAITNMNKSYTALMKLCQ